MTTASSPRIGRLGKRISKQDSNGSTEGTKLPVPKSARPRSSSTPSLFECDPDSPPLKSDNLRKFRAVVKAVLLVKDLENCRYLSPKDSDLKEVTIPNVSADILQGYAQDDLCSDLNSSSDSLAQMFEAVRKCRYLRMPLSLEEEMYTEAHRNTPPLIIIGHTKTVFAGVGLGEEKVEKVWEEGEPE
ncbi:uncharacterized protein LOC5513201 [Nematostella vectensis]|uniref:uncharacterized protein LOC5513201 n=1 Tax=Nematostella vectensis TaxID=45351 RepID=UPI00207725D7|nr:uncharacterized protein LOC5513201 [Nematostella vectensis]